MNKKANTTVIIFVLRKAVYINNLRNILRKATKKRFAEKVS